MRRFVMLAVVALLVLPLPVSARGADIVSGHASNNNPDEELEIDITSGASDATPGVGLDGRGHVGVRYLNVDVDGRVLCVDVRGEFGTVVAEVTRVREGPEDLDFVFITVADGGALPDQVSPVFGRYEPSTTVQETVELFCQAAGAVHVLPQGNLNVKDGAV